MQITLTFTLPDLPKTGALLRFKTWAASARTRRHLSKLDAHLLRDIGLTPEDAQVEASRPFWFQQF